MFISAGCPPSYNTIFIENLLVQLPNYFLKQIFIMYHIQVIIVSITKSSIYILT